MSNDILDGQLSKVVYGHALDELKKLPDESWQMCVCSPPYFGLRMYSTDEREIGREQTPEAYLEHLVAVFRELRRVLRNDGIFWLNLGDSYANDGKFGGETGGKQAYHDDNNRRRIGREKRVTGLKPKDLIGIPWMVAFALRADGWYLRSDIVWAKPNCMPESVDDRPTRAHEFIFLLTKSKKYFYDAEAIRNPPSPDLIKQIEQGYNGEATKEFDGTGAQDASAIKKRIIERYRDKVLIARERRDETDPREPKQHGHSRRHRGFNERWDKLSVKEQMALGSNKRSVWSVPPANYPGAHFATYPPDLIKPCILAGSRPGDIVGDPFFGSGTTGQVAIELGRRCFGIELNPEYKPLIDQRLHNAQPGLPL